MKLLIGKMLLLTMLLQALLGICCCNNNNTQETNLKTPEETNDGLKTGNLTDVKIDARYVEDATIAIKAGKFKEVHSMLIYKDNMLVFEEYFSGHKFKYDGPYFLGEWVDWDKDKVHSIMSDTKSITSICVGIAVDKGFIKSVQQTIFDYLPEHQQFKHDGKENITIEHLLTMTSGLEGNEWTSSYADSNNPIINLWYCEDPIACILEKPLKKEPGSSFSYFGGHQILLGEIIKHASGLNIEEFSQNYLFVPLGITSAEWASRFENGVYESAGGLKMTPRDMIKIGATFMNNGVWNENRIVSKDWVEKSATPYKGNTGINLPGVSSGKNGYSYSWWTNQFNKSGKSYETYNAGGWGGQKIYVIPELNTVVVFTGGNYTSTVKAHKIIQKYIIPAIQ
jgi:CubicO group peptidase (beta-lactamase class C family)